MHHVGHALILAGIATCLLALLLGSATAFAADTPRLDGVKIFPTSGDTNTLFTFMVTYYGTTVPASHDMYLDEVLLAMKSAGAAPNAGVIYKYQTKLTAGTHKYRFCFKVGDQTLLKPGPTADATYTSPTVAQGVTCKISGIIKADGVGLRDVAVKLTQSGSPAVLVRSGADGRYAATGLAPGVWTVTPTKLGFRMDPECRRLTLPPDSATCDFIAIRVRPAGRTG
jgi:hypothetical protein